MFVGVYAGWQDDYLISPEAVSMWNMHVLQFIYPTSEDDLNLFLTRLQLLSSHDIKIVLDLHGFGTDGGWIWKDSTIDYSVIDTIFNMLEPFKDSIYAVTLYEENDLSKASVLNDLYNYIKEKWPWATVYQWFSPYSVPYSSISSVGADGYVIDPYSLGKVAFTNYLLPFFESGKPVICLPYAAIEQDYPHSFDALPEQIPILHGLQIPAIFYAMFEWHASDGTQHWQIIPKLLTNPTPEAQEALTTLGLASTVAAKWEEIQNAITTLLEPVTITPEEFAATLHVTSRTVAARTIGPIGIPLVLLHQLWRLRERFIRPEVHKKLHPLV